MRRFIIGDIHGKYEYLLEVLKKSGFDYENDLLIQIGDIVDRGLEPFECMDELLKINNLILIKGNHDQAFIAQILTGKSVFGSHDNGQRITIQAWNKLTKDQKSDYLSNIFKKQVLYHITEDNILFVHGGFNREQKIDDQEEFSLLWDRDLVKESMSCSKGQKLNTIEDFKEIFIGHTPTIYWDSILPISRGGVTNVDTGSGKGGPLTIMNIDTHEYWQSDHNFIIKNDGIIKKNKDNSIQGEGEE